MKKNETDLRDLIVKAQGKPFTIVLSSGDRIRVASHDHIFLPPLTDEEGQMVADDQRPDFFQVWGKGRSFRWVAFDAITIFEPPIPTKSDHSAE